MVTHTVFLEIECDTSVLAEVGLEPQGYALVVQWVSYELKPYETPAYDEAGKSCFSHARLQFVGYCNTLALICMSPQ